jgi:tetratricopeptide (TPR) repeat protein
MSNALEVKTLKARHSQALSALGLLIGVAASGSIAALGAQTVRTPDPNARRMMVSALKSSDKNLGVQAADAIRSRLNQDVPFKQLWVIPKNDINATLEASGFPTTEALLPHDAKALANLLRADEYISGTVAKTPAGFKVDANLVLARDNSLVQPLPSFEAGRLDQVAGMLSKELQAARKQLPNEQKCVNSARDGKLPDAVAAAKAGIADYPNATLARICLANAYVAMKMPADSIITIANQIAAIDQRSKPALQLLVVGYHDANNEEKYIESLTKLLAADPNNTNLQIQVAEELAKSGKAGLARPIIDKAVADNPGDPDLLNTRWLILLATKDYKEGLKVGEELIKTDTARATASFFTKMASAFSIDSQPQKAAEYAAKGVAKFPNDADLQVLYGSLLRSAGQLPQAAEAYKKALAINPKVADGWGELARLQADLKQLDSAMVTLKAGQAAGADKASLAKYSLAIGNTLYRAANTSKLAPEYKQAIDFLTFSDEQEKSDNAKFLIGASALSMGQSLLVEGSKARNCDMVKQGADALTLAQINLPAGGRAFPEPTKQLLGVLAQLLPAAEQQVRAICR